MNLRQVPSLLVALFLQFAPLVRTVEPVLAGVIQPVWVLLRWVTAATAMAGGAHALSGATGLLSASTVRGTNGIPVSYRAEIFSDEHGTPKAYTATGLPPGMRVVSRASGIIGATPTNSGTYAASVTGWKDASGTGQYFYTATVTFTIVDAPPVITLQPQSRTVTAGETVTLSVAATGSALTYRWLKGDLEVSGATGPNLTFSPVKTSDAGTYRVRVRNSGGTLLSEPAELVVNATVEPPRFSALSPDQSLHEGETLRLEAVATADGAVPVLTWLFEEAPVPGVEGSPLVVSRVVPGMAGIYRAVASANGLIATSTPVRVSVAAPLRASRVSAEASRVTVSVGTIPGRRYVLEGATDAAWTSWQPVEAATASGPMLELVDPDRGADSKVYRVRVE